MKMHLCPAGLSVVLLLGGVSACLESGVCTSTSECCTGLICSADGNCIHNATGSQAGIRSIPAISDTTSSSTSSTITEGRFLQIFNEGPTSNKGGSSTYFGAPITDAPIKAPGAHVGGDPAVFGMRGQFFHFEAADGWYAGVSEPHLQWNWKLTEFTGKTSKTKQDYITGEALTFFDDNGRVQQKLLMEFMDVSKPSQGCPGGLKTPCLHRGNLKVAIGDRIITEAGVYDLFENAKLYAINAPLDCSHMEGKLHEFEEKRAADKRRKLAAVDEDGFEIFTATTDVSGPDCARWLDLRREQGTIYGAEYLTSIIISTPRLMVKFEFRENAKEQWFWTDHTIYGSSDDEDEIWSGIHGETKQANYDNNGFEIMEGRKVIKGKDEDYLVIDGAFGRDFAARI